MIVLALGAKTETAFGRLINRLLHTPLQMSWQQRKDSTREHHDAQALWVFDGQRFCAR